MSKSHSSLRSRLVRAGIATGAVATIVLASATPALAASLPLTLSQTAGPSGGGNTITAPAATATATTAPFGSTVTPAVQFQTVTSTATACTATYSATTGIVTSTTTPPTQTAGVLAVPAANVKKLSTTKLSITVPASVILTNNTATPPAAPSTVKYNLCVYSGTTSGTGGSPLIGNATYTIASKPTITAIDPATGPSLGGTPVTVTGTGFATGAGNTTVSLGGTTLTGVTVAADGKSLTFTSPARAGGEATISITSVGGRVVSSDPDNNGQPADATPGGGDDPLYFTYSNGISVSPNTAPTDKSVDLDIMGVGFLDMDFDNTPATEADADSDHIFLVDGAYNPEDDGNGLKTVGPVVECRSVLIVSDNEVICTLNLATKLDPDDQTTVLSTANDETPLGAYTVTVVRNGGMDVQATGTNEDEDLPYSATDITSTATFTVAPY